MKAIALLTTLFLAGPVFAQSAAEKVLLQRTINNAGKRCDGVANIRAGAAVDNGDTLVIVDCTDGSSHVVRMTPELELSYYMKCGAWANPVKCD